MRIIEYVRINNKESPMVVLTTDVQIMVHYCPSDFGLIDDCNPNCDSCGGGNCHSCWQKDVKEEV